MTKPLTIAHLYPSDMSIYGDRGNVLTLVNRLRWRDIPVQVVGVEPGDDFDVRRADLLVAGGGQDRGQQRVAADLQERATGIREAAAAGMPMLVVCGTYQLFGQFFRTADGITIPGIGVFAASTVAGPGRLVGNVVADTPYGTLAGFANHSGETTLEPGQAALATVRQGHGNNRRDRTEGAVTGMVHGTYLHGPILPRHPWFADRLLFAALARRGECAPLVPLHDDLEGRAAAHALTLV